MKILHTVALTALIAGPAPAEEITGDAEMAWRATGQTFMLTETHAYFVGSFAGPLLTADPDSPLNRIAVHCPGAYDVGVGAEGYCVFTDRDGDTWVAEWTCTATDPAPGAVASCAGTATFSGGTGKYAAAAGGDTFVAHTLAILPDGSSVGVSDFTDFRLSY